MELDAQNIEAQSGDHPQGLADSAAIDLKWDDGMGKRSKCILPY